MWSPAIDGFAKGGPGIRPDDSRQVPYTCKVCGAHGVGNRGRKSCPGACEAVLLQRRTKRSKENDQARRAAARAAKMQKAQAKRRSKLQRLRQRRYLCPVLSPAECFHLREYLLERDVPVETWEAAQRLMGVRV